MFIPDPNFSIPDPISMVKKISGSGCASKNLIILTQKNVSKLSKYDAGCSSRILILIFYPSWVPDPAIKKAPDPGSRTRNTGKY
jgi:hypothetical protein